MQIVNGIIFLGIVDDIFHTTTWYPYSPRFKYLKRTTTYDCSFKNEVARLLVHGLAHLLGYDHQGEDIRTAQKMLGLEKRVLVKLKIWQIFKFEEEEQNS